MKKKIVSYEETTISKENRDKYIKFLKDNPKEIYWDYNDHLSLEQVEMLMEDENKLYDSIWENNIDYQYTLEIELIEELQKEFPELENFDKSDLRDEFLDYICVNMDLKQLIRNTHKVRVRIVIHSNFEGVSYTDRGKGNFKDSDYIHDLKILLKGKYETKSFQQELDNIMSSCNQFIFYFQSDVENLKNIQKDFLNSITIPKNSWAGFYDSWNGSGSLLEVKLTKDITLLKQWGRTEHDSIEIVLDEKNKYSVEETYGLCNVPEVAISVK